MDGVGLWPWWLWALSALWIGTSLVWRPASMAMREQGALIGLAAMYAGLIVFVSHIVPAMTDSSDAAMWPLWLALIAFLISAIACVSLIQLPWQRWASAGAALLAGVVLALLHAPEAAFVCGILALGLARIPSSTTKEADGAVPLQNQWLVGIAAIVTLVVTISLCRHALLLETARSSASRSQAAFPSREFLARQRSANVPLARPPWEIWGLVAITTVALLTTSRAPVTYTMEEGVRA